MTVTFRNSTTINVATGTGTPYAGTTSGSFNLDLPSGVVDGDILIALVAPQGGSAAAATCTPPSGWTLLGSASRTGTGNGGKLFAYYKVASSETGPYAFTLGGFSATTTFRQVGAILAFSGGDTSAPIDVSLIGNKQTTPPRQSQAVTTTKDNDLLLHIVNTPTGPNNDTWTGVTRRIDAGGGTNGLTAADEIAATAGAQPYRTVVITNANVSTTTYDYASATIAIAVPASAPVNTVAPAVSGTAAVGSLLSVTNGTWDGSPTSYSYQWKHNGANIPGATASTYTVASIYAGETITCTVTATNTVGSATATSSGVSIPAAPVNTVAPAITTDGTPATGETITVNTGTWTGTGITYTYQWYRGASPINGETTSSYTLAVSDEGANIRCDVTAHNGGTASGVTASSNVIVPAVSAPLSDESFLNYLTGGTGNTDPLLSLGGGRGGTYDNNVASLFGIVLGSVAQAGGVFYAVVDVRNTHTTATAHAGKAYVENQFPDGSGLELAVAVPTQGPNVNVPALESRTTPPTGVTWITSTDPAAGGDFGDLAPGAWRSLLVRLTVAEGTPAETVAANWDVAFSS